MPAKAFAISPEGDRVELSAIAIEIELETGAVLSVPLEETPDDGGIVIGCWPETAEDEEDDGDDVEAVLELDGGQSLVVRPLAANVVSVSVESDE